MYWLGYLLIFSGVLFNMKTRIGQIHQTKKMTYLGAGLLNQTLLVSPCRTAMIAPGWQSGTWSRSRWWSFLPGLLWKLTRQSCPRAGHGSELPLMTWQNALRGMTSQWSFGLFFLRWEKFHQPSTSSFWHTWQTCWQTTPRMGWPWSCFPTEQLNWTKGHGVQWSYDSTLYLFIDVGVRLDLMLIFLLVSHSKKAPHKSTPNSLFPTVLLHV